MHTSGWLSAEGALGPLVRRLGAAAAAALNARRSSPSAPPCSTLLGLLEKPPGVPQLLLGLPLPSLSLSDGKSLVRFTATSSAAPAAPASLSALAACRVFTCALRLGCGEICMKAGPR